MAIIVFQLKGQGFPSVDAMHLAGLSPWWTVAALFVWSCYIIGGLRIFIENRWGGHIAGIGAITMILGIAYHMNYSTDIYRLIPEIAYFEIKRLISHGVLLLFAIAYILMQSSPLIITENKSA